MPGYRGERCRPCVTGPAADITSLLAALVVLMPTQDGVDWLLLQQQSGCWFSNILKSNI